MPNPTTTNASRLLTGMFRFNRSMSQQFAPLLKERTGMDLRAYFLLKGIQSGDVQPKVLAGRMDVAASLLSRYLDSLQKSGLIERRIDPQDSRRVLLSLTEQGERAVSESDTLINTLAGERLARLDDATRDAFLRGLDILTSEEAPQ